MEKPDLPVFPVILPEIPVISNLCSFVQKNRARRAAVVLDALKACAIRKDEQREFANGIYHLGKIEAVVFASTTIDELRSAGKFTILRNAELRQIISRTMQRLELHHGKAEKRSNHDLLSWRIVACTRLIIGGT